MSKLNRRAILAGAATSLASAPALAGPSVGALPPDPIFAAIEAHRMKVVAFLAADHEDDNAVSTASKAVGSEGVGGEARSRGRMGQKEMAITPDGKNRIIIFGPKTEGTYVGP
jgi:hypothetical protein